MKVIKSERYVLEFDDSDILSALIFWLSRSVSTTQTTQLASYMNNSECTVSRKKGTTTIAFDWKEDPEEVQYGKK